MPVARITITAVSDEGDSVIVWGTPEQGPGDEPIAFVFHTKEERSDVELAERASRLARGTEIVIDYIPVVDGWNRARGLSSPQRPSQECR
ncbi:MAG: hypothetical protein ABFR89_07270 [Actinomycetota bacterium]